MTVDAPLAGLDTWMPYRRTDVPDARVCLVLNTSTLYKSWRGPVLCRSWGVGDPIMEDATRFEAGRGPDAGVLVAWGSVPVVAWILDHPLRDMWVRAITGGQPLGAMRLAQFLFGLDESDDLSVTTVRATFLGPVTEGQREAWAAARARYADAFDLLDD